jgi:hypothetical protein
MGCGYGLQLPHNEPLFLNMVVSLSDYVKGLLTLTDPYPSSPFPRRQRKGRKIRGNLGVVFCNFYYLFSFSFKP